MKTILMCIVLFIFLVCIFGCQTPTPQFPSNDLHFDWPSDVPADPVAPVEKPQKRKSEKKKRRYANFRTTQF